MRETPISNTPTFYTDTNKSGMAGYKSENISKIIQSPCTLFQEIRDKCNSYDFVRFF